VSGGEDAALQRVVIIGSSCAGKSTLAQRLSKITGSPHIQLDALHWLPGWVERDEQEFRADVASAAAGPAWIIDGNYSKVRELVWPRAQTIIWLDYSFRIVFTRAVCRTARRCILREPLYNGNRETLRKALFSRDSILLWVISTFRRHRREFERELYSGAPEFQVLRLRTPRETEQFVEAIPQRG